MKKSVYTLVLMDSVIDEIDRNAEIQKTSRSNLINQILADYVSLVTPEKRINTIFNQIGSILSGDIFSPYIEPHDCTMSLKSSLEYKYRPTIRYEVELYRFQQDEIGQLKVIFRTQSPQLLLELTTFFKLWIKLENLYLKQYLSVDVNYSLSEGRFYRSLILPPNRKYTNEELSKTISNYVKMFDTIMKGYLSRDYRSFAELEEAYISLQQANERPIII